MRVGISRTALTADGGKAVQCGWLTDEFGLPWQIVPRRLPEVSSSPDTAKHAMQARMQMGKIDIAAIEAAAAGN